MDDPVKDMPKKPRARSVGRRRSPVKRRPVREADVANFPSNEPSEDIPEKTAAPSLEPAQTPLRRERASA